MAEYAVIIAGAGKAERNLRNLALNTLDFAPAFDDIGSAWRAQVETQFGARGSLPGVSLPWAPLSDYTIKHKASSRTRPLIEYGRLVRSYTRRGSMYNITKVRPTTAKFGSRYRAKSNKGKIVPVGVFHQTGTKRNNRVYMPARPVVLTNKFLSEVTVNSISRHLFKDWVF